MTRDPPGATGVPSRSRSVKVISRGASPRRPLPPPRCRPDSGRARGRRGARRWSIPHPQPAQREGSVKKLEHGSGGASVTQSCDRADGQERSRLIPPSPARRSGPRRVCSSPPAAGATARRPACVRGAPTGPGPRGGRCRSDDGARGGSRRGRPPLSARAWRDGAKRRRAWRRGCRPRRPRDSTPAGGSRGGGEARAARAALSKHDGCQFR